MRHLFAKGPSPAQPGTVPRCLAIAVAVLLTAARLSARVEAEIEFWNAVKDSGDPGDITLYLEQFPGGTFFEHAQRRLVQLRGELSSEKSG